MTRLSRPNTIPVPRPSTLPLSPAGAQEHADRATAEEALQPLRRVEEVERVARRRRVEHEQVEAAVLVELVELRDRRELLRARDRVGELLVDPVREHLVARARRRARAARSAGRRCAWRRASSPTARRRPRCRRRPAARDRPAAARCRAPRARATSASRFAGSIVTTATRSPRSAIPSAEGRRRRRLADAAGARADDDPLPFQQRLDGSHRTDIGSRVTGTSVREVTSAPRGAVAARRRIASDQAFADGERHGLRAAAGVELGDDVVQDVLHGAFRVAELLGDLPCRMAGGDQRQDLLLAVGQRRVVRAAVVPVGMPRRRCARARRAAPASRRRRRWRQPGPPRPAPPSSACPCAGSRSRPPAWPRARCPRRSRTCTRARARPSIPTPRR